MDTDSNNRTADVPPARTTNGVAGQRAAETAAVREVYNRNRGYLPHIDGGTLVQHVVFRLADSLPRTVVEKLKQDCMGKSTEDAREYLRFHIDQQLDSCLGACILRNPAFATMVNKAIQHFDKERYHLVAWCVMPNHVHALVQPINGWPIAKIVHSWKSFTAHEIQKHRGPAPGAAGTAAILDDCTAGVPPARTTNGLSGRRAAGTAAVQNHAHIWYREYFDRFMRNPDHTLQTIEYIHNNPVKAGLVKQPADWPWSSAGLWEAGKVKWEL